MFGQQYWAHGVTFVGTFVGAGVGLNDPCGPLQLRTLYDSLKSLLSSSSHAEYNSLHLGRILITRL